MSTEIGRDDIGVNTVAGGETSEAHSRQLFDHGKRHVRGCTSAAIGLIDIWAQKSRLTECVPELARHHVILFPLFVEG